MPKLDEYPKKNRVFKAKHLEPGDYQMGYILLPIGYSYNSEWMTAKKGDFIMFHGGGKHKIRVVRIVKVKGGLAELLSQIRYGITIAGCIQRWKENARLEGNAPAAVSSDECLWVVYEKAAED